MTKRVLLAEDDQPMAQLLTDVLRQEGFDVVGSTNGVELLDSVDDLRGKVINGRFFDVDLIISDIRMPWMSGLEALRELRQVDRATPVILITAFGDDRTHAEARRLGASAVLDKPFDMDDFRRTVHEHAGLEQRRREALAASREPGNR
jgi:CheY-like chemotaxis protein